MGKSKKERKVDPSLKIKYDYEKYDEHIKNAKEQLKILSEAIPEVEKTQIDMFLELKSDITKLIEKGYSYDSIAKAISNEEITFLPKSMKRICSKKTPIFIESKEMVRIGKDKNGKIMLEETKNKGVQHTFTEEEFVKKILTDERNKNHCRLWNWAEKLSKEQKEIPTSSPSHDDNPIAPENIKEGEEKTGDAGATAVIEPENTPPKITLSLPDWLILDEGYENKWNRKIYNKNGQSYVYTGSGKEKTFNITTEQEKELIDNYGCKFN